jgi:hypothetical protein
MTMPWCSKVVWKLVSVVSCPPCCVAVLANTLPTLPMSLPPAHRPPVWSRKLRICAAMLPKRVGVPKMMASYCGSSSTVATGAACWVLKPDFAATSAGTSSGTRFTATSAPAARAPSATAPAMASTWP